MFRAMVVLIAATATLAFTNPARAAEAGVQVGFSDGEVSIIRAYYRDHAPAPGHAGGAVRPGGKPLPPGIAKNLQRGKPLPPGIARQSLPSGLIELLPPPPKGFERIEVAGKVLLVEIATQVVHDILADAVLRR